MVETETDRSTFAIAVLAGLVVGVVVVIVAISFAALIFSGELSEHIARGIGFSLFTATVIGAIVAMSSSFPGMVATPQDSPAAILGLVAATLVAGLAGSASSETVFATVVVAIALSSLLTGVFFLLLGHFELGGLIRFIPFPVIGGFLAGTGWLLLKGSVGVMSGVSPTVATVLSLFETDVLVRWFPGAAFGVLLLVVLRRTSHFLVLPGLLVGSTGVFYLVLLLSGTSVARASAMGLLLGPFPSGGLWRPLSTGELALADWNAIAAESGSLAAILVVGAVALLLNASGLELATRRDIDLDRELRSAGVANLISGLGGGFVGFQTLALSALGQRLAPDRRVVGLVSAGLCGGTLLFGATALSFFPRQVLGGLLLFLGLSFIGEWVIDARTKLPRSDYLVVLLILVVIATVGFLESVGVGIVIAVVLFVVNYSRIDVVKHALSGAVHHSNVARPREHRRLLVEHGEQQLILELQGFIFFGTANGLVQRVRARTDQRTDVCHLRFVVLDFRLVNGLDSSAVLSFVKLGQMAVQAGFVLVLAQCSPAIRRQLDKGGLSGDSLQFVSELDRGVEWCEEQILATLDLEVAPVERTLHEHLGEIFREPGSVEIVLGYLDRCEARRGEYLMRQGEPAENIYLIESGRVTAQIELDDGTAVRLLTMGAGAIVGELELYLRKPRSASVLVEEDTVVHRVSAESLVRMETEHSELAASFHSYMARLLAERLANTNSTLRALLR